MKAVRQKTVAECPRKSNDKLTPKQKVWLKAFLNSDNRSTFLNKTESSKAARYACTTDESFASIGHQNFRKLQVYIEEWMDEEGLGESNLKTLLLSGLQAVETKFFAHEGRVVDIREVTAWETRRRYLEIAMKVKGMFAPEKHEHKHSVDPWGDLLDAVTKTNTDELPNRIGKD
jgi:hypothetical protein